MTSIFTIIVHFGSRQTTNKAILSLENGSRAPEHCIVIDHGDTPNSPLNKGYAAGLVSGIGRAISLGAKKSDLLVFMNNDSIVEYRGIEHLVSWWNMHGGPNILAGHSWGSVSLVTGRAHITGDRYIKSVFHIPYIHGSCMVLEVGLASKLAFPEDFFMYWEDVALSIRAQKSGAKLVRIPFPLIHHNDMATSLSQQKLYYLVRNGAYVLEREIPNMWRLYWCIINTTRRAYHQLKHHQIISRALFDARNRTLGKIQL